MTLSAAIAPILDLFQPITLNEMDAVKLMNRVDTKFAFSFDDLKRLLPQLAEHYKILEIEGTKTPFYESLYYDDKDFLFYKDHHAGKTNRYKVRFRNYVESDLSFLEIKHKIKGRTKKSRIIVDKIHGELSEDDKQFLGKNIQKSVQLVPKLWNSFHRMTLVNNERKERLTLDFDLQFKWGGEHRSFDNLVIAELKQELINKNTPFYELMKKNFIRPYRLSKYCLGTIEIYGRENIKYNRFKEKLLKLKTINNANSSNS